VSIPSVMVNWEVGKRLRDAINAAQEFIMTTDTDHAYLPLNFTYMVRGCGFVARVG
jgi:hypothetical protein